MDFQLRAVKGMGYKASAKGKNLKLMAERLRVAPWSPGVQFSSLESEHAQGSMSAEQFKSKHRGNGQK